MSSMESQVKALAASFVTGLMKAVRGVALRELHDAKKIGRTRSTPATGERTRPSRTAPGAQAGRMAQRSAEEIEHDLAFVVAYVSGHAEGQRAEQIREALRIETPALSRVLKGGLKAKLLRSTGRGRATTYFAMELAGARRRRTTAG